jgi:hypothetical protein
MAAAAAMSILRDGSGAEPWREMNRVEQASGMGDRGGRAALCGGLYGLEAEVEVGAHAPDGAATFYQPVLVSWTWSRC